MSWANFKPSPKHGLKLSSCLGFAGEMSVAMLIDCCILMFEELLVDWASLPAECSSSSWHCGFPCHPCVARSPDLQSQPCPWCPKYTMSKSSPSLFLGQHSYGSVHHVCEEQSSIMFRTTAAASVIISHHVWIFLPLTLSSPFIIFVPSFSFWLHTVWATSLLTGLSAFTV